MLYIKYPAAYAPMPFAEAYSDHEISSLFQRKDAIQLTIKIYARRYMEIVKTSVHPLPITSDNLAMGGFTTAKRIVLAVLRDPSVETALNDDVE
jgi:hypothetical protein